MLGSGPGDPRRSRPTTSTTSTDHATDLLRARAALITPPVGARRLGPGALRGALVDLHDLWLSTRVAASGAARGTALVAVGSLARRELAPYSGLDLLLVHDGARPDRAAALAEALGPPLQAAGLAAQPPVRTVGEAVETSLDDVRIALALLGARMIAGDPEPADRLGAAARRAWRAGWRTRVDDLVELTQARWRRADDVAHRLEPELRDGRGGLRDVELLDALAVAGTVDAPSADVRAARTLLLDLRTELHRRAGRARDVLLAEDARDLVDAGSDHHALARSVSGAARAVTAATDAALRRARPAVAPRTPPRHALGEGVVEHAGEVTPARRASVARDPVLVLRLATAAARTGLPIAPQALRRLADAAPELRAPWPDSARTELFALLGAGDGLVAVVEALDRAGLWGRLFPEWGVVRDLPPGDARHVWTVDRHLVEVTRHAAALASRVSRPDLLLLAALVHDLGRGRDDDPLVVGAVLAGHIGRRLGLSAADTGTLERAVRHHRLLPRTVRRHDPGDPATVRQVVAVLEGDSVLLEILHALAEADALGTGPGVWTPWSAALLGELVGRCRAAMVDGVPSPAVS
ncbi:HD domain-containing protein [Actinomycetospora termitidis]|uniref:HD domain-containing protein n=1 Tax=Actinomycetospora termitidis TaxID=3053470 RepID=A0ABT7MGR2_9PSEU|nr:HD domain-containing protein [Actinomycetospora sp. Odt1-22]MDL5159856.1 HD domain-containing protein [Actinomycetospora sp. Odt1-22]